MTYREMLQALSSLSSDQLDMDATVYLSYSDEYVPISSLLFTEETDVLDKDHPVLCVDA